MACDSEGEKEVRHSRVEWRLERNCDCAFLDPTEGTWCDEGEVRGKRRWDAGDAKERKEEVAPKKGRDSGGDGGRMGSGVLF